MSIVESVKRVCSGNRIAHNSSDDEKCPTSIGRGRGKKRVSILLNGLPVPHVVVDLDDVSDDCLVGREIGDYMIFIDKNEYNTNLIVPIEISYGGNKTTKKITSQLESSATLALEHIDEKMSVDIVPIFAGKPKNAGELINEKIHMRGNVYYTRLAKNKDKVVEIIKKYLQGKNKK